MSRWPVKASATVASIAGRCAACGQMVMTFHIVGLPTAVLATHLTGPTGERTRCPGSHTRVKGEARETTA